MSNNDQRIEIGRRIVPSWANASTKQQINILQGATPLKQQGGEQIIYEGRLITDKDFVPIAVEITVRSPDLGLVGITYLLTSQGRPLRTKTITVIDDSQ